MMPRPTTREELLRTQEALRQLRPGLWQPEAPPTSVAGCFATFPVGASGLGSPRDPVWAAAALVRPDHPVATTVVADEADAPYEPGLLFLRAGRALEAAVRALPERPEVLLVNATGLDHPRRAGLAVHLGMLLDLPTVGVTHRPLCATGDWPLGDRGGMSKLVLDGEIVGYWVRTRAGARPLAVHAGWRAGPEVAAAIVLAATRNARTPEPLRWAREAARKARTQG